MIRAASLPPSAPWALLVLAMLMLSACSSGPMAGGPSSDAVGPSGVPAAGQVDLATQQACRARVNEMYEVRDRGDVYAANPSSNTPYSANYQPDVPSRGLSDQFAYGQSIRECEHNALSGAGPVMTPPPPSGTTGR